MTSLATNKKQIKYSLLNNSS